MSRHVNISWIRQVHAGERRTWRPPQSPAPALHCSAARRSTNSHALGLLLGSSSVHCQHKSATTWGHSWGTWSSRSAPRTGYSPVQTSHSRTCRQEGARRCAAVAWLGRVRRRKGPVASRCGTACCITYPKRVDVDGRRTLADPTQQLRGDVCRQVRGASFNAKQCF